MKRNVLISLTLVTALIGMTGLAVAHGGPHGSHHGPGHCDGPPEGMMGGGGNSQHLLHMLRNANDLDVTDEQIDQIESILENARPRFEALGEQLRTQRDAWQESNDPAVFDEAATRQFAENQAALHANLMVHQMQTRAAVLSVLTPEQRETLQQIRSEMQGRRGGKKHSKPCR